MTKIIVKMNDDCRTAVISGEYFTLTLNDLDNSFPVDSDAIFNALFDNRRAFGIPDSSWKDSLDDSEYSTALQYVDFITSFDGENTITFEGDF